jgi:hypothetical protein
MKRRLFITLAFIITNTAMATETPEYKIIRQNGQFELREYPTLLVARTPMGDGDFMRLFRFISGNNAKEEKIAMTAPVLVSHEGDDAGIGFIMPAEMPVEEVPTPKAGDISLETIPAGQFAVYRFSGGRNADNEARALKLLLEWIKMQMLKPSPAPPMFGYFDPPWIPAFMRRNEVMLRIEEDPVSSTSQHQRP